MELTTPAQAAGRVTEALKSAAQATGAGFDYLVRTAKRESSLNPTAQNSASSARGLFQFIDSTWLEVLKEEGGKLGLGEAAASVQKTSSGRYMVQDPARRAELLAMRDDPAASALLAGAFTRRNAAQMTSALGRPPTEGELYAAHFLGAKGASQLANLASASPDSSAVAAFPSQASANRAIFYDSGRPRSVGEVYARLTAGATATVSVPSIAQAADTATVATVRVARAEPVEPAYNNGVENDQAAFHSMFKTGRRSPVSAYVAQAWSSLGEAGLAADTTGGARRASETIAPAYAPQSSAVAPESRAAAAVDAVIKAATSSKRRVKTVSLAGVTPTVAVPAPLAAAKPAVDVAKTARATAARAEAPATERPGALISFLKTVFSPPATTSAAATKSGARP